MTLNLININQFLWHFSKITSQNKLNKSILTQLFLILYSGIYILFLTDNLLSCQ